MHLGVGSRESRRHYIGRGRSPQNWALITGAQKFYISLFVLTEGIDDGKIVDEKCFGYNEYDDIKIFVFQVIVVHGGNDFEFLSSPELRLASDETIRYSILLSSKA